MRRHRRIFQSNASSLEEINISPLIDIVFILLIFFIVTTVFIDETGVEIRRPQSASAVSLEKKSILIAITEQGSIHYAGEKVNMREVRTIIQRLLKKENMDVIIQADKKVPIELYTRVHDEAILGGATKVSLATLH